jgi:methyl-accepting chemotaxis protein
MIQWFANRTIRQKLVLGFGTLIALVVLLAAVTVRNNVAVQANYEALADDSFPVVRSLGEADLRGARVVESSSELVQMLLAQHRSATVAGGTGATDTAALIAALDPHELDDMNQEIKEQQDDLQQALKNFSDIEDKSASAGFGTDGSLEERDHIVGLGKALLGASVGLVAQIAAHADMEEILAAQEKMHEADAEFFSTLDKKIADESGELGEKRDVTEGLLGKSTQTLLAFAGVALLIGLGISLLIANQVATPVRALRDATLQLGAGDFKAGEALAGFKAKDEIGELIGAFNVARDTFLRAARIQTALENTASVVLMADLEGKIIYANQAAQRYFRDMETEIRAKLSEFRAGEIGNTNVASFFGDNEAAQERLGELSETYRERTRFGGRTVDLTANPVMNESGGRLGTVMEWVDVTDQLKVEAEIAEGVTSIKAATVQLTAGAQDLSARTEEQVASLEEMAASIRQLSVTVKQNADNAQQANQLALAARSAAEGGGEVAVTAVTAMGEIEQSSQRIAEIVGLIDEIAFQTNLLALNAAVEAARAGDAGRGFAVVAAEVRSLAQRSSQASKEIKGLISTSNGHVKRGVELVSKAGGSLGEIVTSVKKVADIVSEIAAASQEQSAGVQQVDESVTAMEGVTQKNAALVEESTASVNSVDRQMEQLSLAVRYLRTAGEDAKGDARLLQEGLSQRVGGETADKAPATPAAPAHEHAEPAPAKRAAGSRLAEF